MASVLLAILIGCSADVPKSAPQEPANRGIGFDTGVSDSALIEGAQPAAQTPGNADERPAPAPSSPPVPYRGLWVLCEGSRRVLEDPARVEELIEHAQAMEVSDLFVQVYRGGRAWFSSQRADEAPYRAIVERTGDDPLKHLIAEAHRAGLRVHAWVNVLSLSRNRDAPILRELGPDAVHVDRLGRSILDYPESLELPEPDSNWYRVGTPGIYLDPGSPGVADYLVATFEELVRGYPELDGLHLDYIRHPGVLPFVPGSRFGVGIDYGYGAASRLQFRRENGIRGPFANSQNPDRSRILNSARWDAWRRDKVTELVERIGSSTEVLRPGLRISTAVISYADRAYLSLAQDWQRWIEDDLVDFVVPMIYTKDERLFRYQVESFTAGPRASRIWAGVGVWLFASDPDRALAQLRIARQAGSVGDALFSYDSIADAKAPANGISLLEALSRNPPDVR